MQRWRDLMDKLSHDSCAAYRSVVYNNPVFLGYFKNATPESELGNLNIGASDGMHAAFWVVLGHMSRAACLQRMGAHVRVVDACCGCSSWAREICHKMGGEGRQ